MGLSQHSQIPLSLDKEIRSDEQSRRISPQTSVLKELKSLKKKSNRARPRKSQVAKENKHFKISKKKRNRNGMGLQPLDGFNIHIEKDEAREIFETGVQMGLLPETNEEESLKLINERLLQS